MGPKKGGKGKGGKGGKKKKKKDKEAERKEQERLEQERIERERLEQERLEKERKLREEEERRLAEERRIKREEELKRLTEELDEDRLTSQHREQRIWASVAKDRQGDEWARYIDNSRRPLENDEAEVNTFLATLLDDDDRTLKHVMKQLSVAEEVAELLEKQWFSAEEWLEVKNTQKYSTLFHQTCQVQNTMMDRMTANTIQYADEHINDLNPDVKGLVEGDRPRGDVKQGHVSRGSKFGLWINLEKRPRTKIIEYPNINTVLEIPKSLALASVAIRVVHQNNNHVSNRYHTAHISLGGVIAVELLALPPPPKQVKSWTIRQVTRLAHTIQRLPYPIPPAGVDLSINETNLNAPPMKVTYSLAKDIIVHRSGGDDELKVGWWDDTSQDWNTLGVQEVKFDVSTRAVTFSTCRLSTTFTLLQKRTLHFPYKSWHVRPVGENANVVAINTSINETVEIRVENGKCILLSPAHEELQSLRAAYTSPLLLLNRLARCGINLLPQEADSKFLKGIVMKSVELDQKAYREMAHVSPAFIMQNSKWNQGLGANKCMILARQTLDYTDRSLSVDDEWCSVVIDHEKVALVQAKEMAPECVDDLLPEEVTHLDSIRAMTGSTLSGRDVPAKCSPEAFNRILDADPKHVETLHHLLQHLKVLSLV
eukprot:TRINITY_DN16189_c0_g1::TRINITY_DN16189_c0_g1_i1::g.6445::m.6445 TRINITY_DN16189_c0_g1::TRINITY_DN16189_c0_g1_i1::g.6445  ORF type:complete len:655 (-),score=146.57,sp/Q8T880/AXP83_CIOIN/29.43/1e-32,sp/Q8T880/AXP83_CIOIN/24.65/4e-12,GPS/PF01825.16/0.51,DDRGK/PF09756.4/1.6,DUF2870/PF11069.3/3.2e+03,DUF2870/PF11069.3/0.82 TRINITY_DN16189_c0_g1_i1:66-2030(-)